jgi:hypothetical protein
MELNIDLNNEFKIYGNEHEIVWGIQVNDEHICKIARGHAGKEIILRLDNIRLAYKFYFILNERCFSELHILGRFNGISSIAYRDDYVVRNKSDIYILNKEKFESLYSLLEYEKIRKIN